MDKNKIYMKMRELFTRKQVDEIIDWWKIATTRKEKKVKKTWNKIKKEYSRNVLRCKKDWNEEL